MIYSWEKASQVGKERETLGTIESNRKGINVYFHKEKVVSIELTGF